MLLHPAAPQGSDVWTAALAYQAVFQASRCWVDSVPPRQALALLAEADAAYERCRKLLPNDWLVYVQREQRRAHAMQFYLDMHGASPARWLPMVYVPETAARHLPRVRARGGTIALRPLPACCLLRVSRRQLWGPRVGAAVPDQASRPQFLRGRRIQPP